MDEAAPALDLADAVPADTGRDTREFRAVLSSDWRILAASPSFAAYCRDSSFETVGHPLGELWSEEAVHVVRNNLALARGGQTTRRIYRLRLGGEAPACDLELRREGELIFIAGEHSGPPEHGDLYGTVRGMIADLRRAGSVTQALDDAARQLRALSGFDAVLITRGASAAVVAKSARSADHLPSGDIAAAVVAAPGPGSDVIACIADSSSPPGEMVGLPAALKVGAPASARLADQLHTAGIGAAMSVAVRIGADDWGAIAAFSRAARRLSVERRAAIELFAQMLAMRIECLELRAKTDAPAG